MRHTDEATELIDQRTLTCRLQKAPISDSQAMEDVVEVDEVAAVGSTEVVSGVLLMGASNGFRL